MDDATFKQVTTRADRIWCLLEEHRIAVVESRRRDIRKVRGLKWATVIGGVVTGITSIGLLASQTEAYVTGISGFVTGAIGTVSGAFNWTADAERKTNTLVSVTAWQAEISGVIHNISLNRIDEDPGVIFTRIQTELNGAIARSNVIPSEEDKQAALEAVSINGFSTIDFIGSAAASLDVIEPEVPEEGLENFTAVARGM